MLPNPGCPYSIEPMGAIMMLSQGHPGTCFQQLNPNSIPFFSDIEVSEKSETYRKKAELGRTHCTKHPGESLFDPYDDNCTTFLLQQLRPSLSHSHGWIKPGW